MNRLSRGDQISLVGAVVLFIGLFLPWYKVKTGSSITDQLIDQVAGTLNAFKTFEFIDIVLLLLAIGAAALILLTSAGKLDQGLKRFVETIGGVATIAVLFRLIFKPDGGGVIDVNLSWGIFIALLGAIGIVAGQTLQRTGKL